MLKFTELMVASTVFNAVIAGLKGDEFSPVDDIEEGFEEGENFGEDLLFAGKNIFEDWLDGYGDGVAFDPIYQMAAGIKQGIEEGGDDFWKIVGLGALRSVQNVAGDFASNFPLSNGFFGIMGADSDTLDTLFNGTYYQGGGAGSPALSTLSTAVKKTAKGELADALATLGKSFLLPFGGSQADKTIRGLYEYYNGATTDSAYERMLRDGVDFVKSGFGKNEVPNESEEQLKYLVEPTKENFIKSLLFGPASQSGANDAYYNTEWGLKPDAEETKEILAKKGYEERKTLFDEIVAVKQYKRGEDKRREAAADRYFEGDALGGELYALYKSGEDAAVPFRNIYTDHYITVDETEYTLDFSAEEAQEVSDELVGRLMQRFADMDSSPYFGELEDEEKVKFINAVAKLEKQYIAVEELYERGMISEDVYSAEERKYRQKIAEKEFSLYVDDPEAYRNYIAADMERQYLQYGENLTPETKKQVKKYSEYMKAREPDSVDIEMTRLYKESGEKMNVMGNPSGILKYEKDHVDYYIDMPDTQVYSFIHSLDSTVRSELNSLFSTQKYKNAEFKQKKKMIDSVKSKVRARIKKTLKARYKSVRVPDEFDEIVDLK